MLPFDKIRIYLRTQRTDAELQPFLDMAIAATECVLGNSILHYGDETPKPIAQATLMILGSIYNADTELALRNASGLLDPYTKATASEGATAVQDGDGSERYLAGGHGGAGGAGAIVAMGFVPSC